MTLPTMGFMFIFPVVCYFTIVQLTTAIPNIAIVGISILVGWTLGWLSWSYFVVKWKVHAFSNVDKTLWAKLYRSAVKENLIWEIGSIFEKTEIRNTQQNHIINKINSELSTINSSERAGSSLEDLVVNDDGSLPTELPIRYKKADLYANISLPVIFGAIGTYLIGYTDQIIMGVISLVIIVTKFETKKAVYLFGENPVQITFSNSGINFHMFESVQFVPWKDVDTIIVNSEKSGLYTNYWKGEELIEVTLNTAGFNLIKKHPNLLDTINIYMKRNYNDRALNE